MFNAKTFDGFLSPDKCEFLINSANQANLWGGGGAEFWAGRVTDFQYLKKVNKEAASILVDANNRCKEAIKETYNLDKDIYSDTLQIIRWFENMSQPPHADDMSNTEVVGYSHRVFGSIIYLNSSYSGGHTYYPNYNIEVTPEVGKLAVHPGDPNHLHGVTTITGGMRYTIASFWTYDKEKSFEWTIH